MLVASRTQAAASPRIWHGPSRAGADGKHAPCQHALHRLKLSAGGNSDLKLVPVGNGAAVERSGGHQKGTCLPALPATDGTSPLAQRVAPVWHRGAAAAWSANARVQGDLPVVAPALGSARPHNHNVADSSEPLSDAVATASPSCLATARAVNGAAPRLQAAVAGPAPVTGRAVLGDHLREDAAAAGSVPVSSGGMCGDRPPDVALALARQAEAAALSALVEDKVAAAVATAKGELIVAMEGLFADLRQHLDVRLDAIGNAMRTPRG